MRVAARVLREQSAERVGLAASGAAFWLVISAFPTAIAVVSLFGLVVSPDRVASDLGEIASRVPGSLGSLLTDQVRHVASTGHGGVSFGLAVSLVLALWSASAGIKNLDGAIRIAYGLPPQTYFDAKGRAFLGAAAAVVLVGLAAVATPVVFGHSRLFVTLISVPVALVLIGVAAGAMYRFSIGHRVGVRALLPGAIASASGVVLVTAGFGAYIDASSRYAAVYGAFAGAVIGMLAIYLAVYVLLLGAVLNVELSGRRQGGRKTRG
ncbi:MAG TPA: YihY/virulence factor BrkB family protein [Acidimicrobiales bacterium]|nr:YihY/virulence factor BrkB family protein [Acidimicrobiales bacterium]